MTNHKYNAVDALCRAGIAHSDAIALRRISMTLHRWHELECNGEVTRDESTGQTYAQYGVGTSGPFLTAKCADREAGALKRLASTMARYPGFTPYVQGDPRGASLYILRPGDVREGASIDSCYSNGIAVCK